MKSIKVDANIAATSAEEAVRRIRKYIESNSSSPSAVVVVKNTVSPPPQYIDVEAAQAVEKAITDLKKFLAHAKREHD